MRRNYWGLNIAACGAWAALFIFLDQLTKKLVVDNIKGNPSVTVIPGVINFSYVENRGAAWGMFADQRWVFISVSLIAMAGIIAYVIWKKPKDFLLCSSLVLVFAGGVGNMIDRLYLGYVVDFLDLDFVPLKEFPVFNVADSCVCIGAGLLILYLLISTVKESKNAKKTKAGNGSSDSGDKPDADENGDGGNKA